MNSSVFWDTKLMQPAETQMTHRLLHAAFLLGLVFDLQVKDLFLRNVAWLNMSHIVIFQNTGIFITTKSYKVKGGTHGSIIGWVIMLHAGRSWVRFSMRSFDLSTELMLPAILWPRGRFSLQQRWMPGIFLGSKARPAHKVDNLTVICEPIV
jgi:hypothetical protein